MWFISMLIDLGWKPLKIDEHFSLTLWYPRHQLQLRIGLFFGAASLAGAFSGLLAYGISFMSGTQGLLGWSWIFVSRKFHDKAYLCFMTMSEDSGRNRYSCRGHSRILRSSRLPSNSDIFDPGRAIVHYLQEELVHNLFYFLYSWLSVEKNMTTRASEKRNTLNCGISGLQLVTGRYHFIYFHDVFIRKLNREQVWLHILVYMSLIAPRTF